MLGQLHNARFVSTMDISQGFFHYALDKSSKYLTAFAYGDAVYQFERLPQGLNCSSRLMQYKMSSFVKKHRLHGVSIYIDNILLYAATLEEYKQRLEALFRACVKDDIKCKMRNCFHFIQDKLILFGFNIDLRNHSLAPEPDKINKISSIIPPN